MRTCGSCLPQPHSIQHSFSLHVTAFGVVKYISLHLSKSFAKVAILQGRNIISLELRLL